MKHTVGSVAGLLLTLSAAIPAASAQTRTLDVPATAGWQHAKTKLILRSKIAALPRTALTDAGTAELDVQAQFQTPEGDTVLTVYLFRPALASVPVWFDRSETQIFNRDVYGTVQPNGAAIAFAPPRATTASGLRRVYSADKPPFKTTGLAMMPLGEWLVGIRLSAKQLDAAQLDAKMREVIAAIGWPEGVVESPAAETVAPCPTQLKYAKRARVMAPNMTDALLGSALLSTAASKAEEAKDDKARAPAPSRYCRDLPPTPQYGVYREPDETDGYLLAVGDAGRVIRVSPAIPLLDSGKGYMVSLDDLDSTAIYPKFDRLAHPDQALQLVMRSAPLSSSSRDGKTITINARP